MLAFSSRKNKRGGGSVQQSLDYLDPEYGTPNAPAGQNLLVERGGIARPMIGGFIPSVMKGVVNSGAVLGPLVAIEAKRLWNGNSTRKRRGGGKKEDWARNRESAREILSQYGKPSGFNVNKLAALLRKDPQKAQEFLMNYQAKKTSKPTRKVSRVPKTAMAQTPILNGPRVARHVFFNEDGNVIAEEELVVGRPPRLRVNTVGRIHGRVNKAKTMKVKPTHLFFNNSGKVVKKPKKVTIVTPKTATPLATQTVQTARNRYLQNLAGARENLSRYGPATVANVAQYVSLKRKGENVSTFLSNFQTRKAQKGKPVITTGTLASALPSREGYVPIPNEPKTQTQKRTRKVSNEWKTLYTQAKANLAATGKKAKAYEIGTLASLRKKGQNNAAFMTAFKKQTE